MAEKKERFRTSIILAPELKATLEKAAADASTATGKHVSTNNFIEGLLRKALKKSKA